MKINSLVFLFLMISFTTFSQELKDGQNELKEILFSIPDSVFSDKIFDFAKENKQFFWDQYLNGKYENIEMSNDRIYGKTNLMFRNDTINVDVFIDYSGRILRIMNRNTDAIPTCDVKIYNNGNKKIIGVTIKSSDHATTHTDEIVFYKYKRKKFINITGEVLSGFNYKKDNYCDTTIKLINAIYGNDVISNPFNNKLLYRFTCSDTVYITESFFGIDEEIGLDEKYFDGEFFTKKYIMKKGKLKLAE